MSTRRFLLSLCACAASACAAPTVVVPAIAPIGADRVSAPGETVLQHVVHAEGGQNYLCEKSAWKHVGPDATLRTTDGALVGSHGASTEAATSGKPFWLATDSSRIVGAKKAAAPAPNSASDIDWLLLDVVEHSGATGMLTPVTHVRRVSTSGGKAPDGTCTDGQTHRALYRALYEFYVPR